MEVPLDRVVRRVDLGILCLEGHRGALQVAKVRTAFARKRYADARDALLQIRRGQFAREGPRADELVDLDVELDLVRLQLFATMRSARQVLESWLSRRGGVADTFTASVQSALTDIMDAEALGARGFEEALSAPGKATAARIDACLERAAATLQGVVNIRERHAWVGMHVVELIRDAGVEAQDIASIAELENREERLMAREIYLGLVQIVREQVPDIRLDMGPRGADHRGCLSLQEERLVNQAMTAVKSGEWANVVSVLRDLGRAQMSADRKKSKPLARGTVLARIIENARQLEDAAKRRAQPGGSTRASQG